MATTDASEGPVVFLTLTEAAARLGVSEKTAGRYVAAGKLPARRNPASGRLLFRREDIDALAAGAPVAPAG